MKTEMPIYTPESYLFTSIYYDCIKAVYLEEYLAIAIGVNKDENKNYTFTSTPVIQKFNTNATRTAKQSLVYKF